MKDKKKSKKKQSTWQLRKRYWRGTWRWKICAFSHKLMDLYPLHLRITLARVEINLQIRNLQKFKSLKKIRPTRREFPFSLFKYQIWHLWSIGPAWSKQDEIDLERSAIWNLELEILCGKWLYVGWRGWRGDRKRKCAEKGEGGERRRRINFCGQTKGSANYSTRGPRRP